MANFRLYDVFNPEDYDEFQAGLEEKIDLLSGAVKDSLVVYGQDPYSDRFTSILSYKFDNELMTITVCSYSKYLSDRDHMYKLMEEARALIGDSVNVDYLKAYKGVKEYLDSNETGILAGDEYPPAPSIKMTSKEFSKYVAYNYKTNPEGSCQIIW